MCHSSNIFRQGRMKIPNGIYSFRILFACFYCLHLVISSSASSTQTILNPSVTAGGFVGVAWGPKGTLYAISAQPGTNTYTAYVYTQNQSPLMGPQYLFDASINLPSRALNATGFQFDLPYDGAPLCISDDEIWFAAGVMKVNNSLGDVAIFHNQGGEYALFQYLFSPAPLIPYGGLAQDMICTSNLGKIKVTQYGVGTNTSVDVEITYTRQDATWRLSNYTLYPDITNASWPWLPIALSGDDQTYASRINSTSIQVKTMGTETVIQTIDVATLYNFSLVTRIAFDYSASLLAFSDMFYPNASSPMGRVVVLNYNDTSNLYDTANPTFLDPSMLGLEGYAFGSALSFAQNKVPNDTTVAVLVVGAAQANYSIGAAGIFTLCQVNATFTQWIANPGLLQPPPGQRSGSIDSPTTLFGAAMTSSRLILPDFSRIVIPAIDSYTATTIFFNAVQMCPI